MKIQVADSSKGKIPLAHIGKEETSRQKEKRGKGQQRLGCKHIVRYFTPKAALASFCNLLTRARRHA